MLLARAPGEERGGRIQVRDSRARTRRCISWVTGEQETCTGEGRKTGRESIENIKNKQTKNSLSGARDWMLSGLPLSTPKVASGLGSGFWLQLVLLAVPTPG